MKSTQRSLIELERRKWPAGLVERRIPYANRTVDFLGFADILALDGRPGVLAIQACLTDVQPHVVKLVPIPNLRKWLEAGNRCSIWSFRKLKVKRGGKAIRWTLRELVARIKSGRVVFVERRRVQIV